MRSILSWLSGRSLTLPLLSVILPILVMSGCTDYRPLGKGAKVPWSGALARGEGGPIGPHRYRVGEGDALSLIAEHYGLGLSVLAAANNIESPYIIYPGEVLRIPSNSRLPRNEPGIRREPPVMQTAQTVPRRRPSADLPAPRWSPKARPAQAGQSAPADREPGVRRYAVQRGDSLSGIAERHGLSLGEMVAANDLEPPYRIMPGQGLIIPPTESERSRASLSSAGRAPAGPLVPPPALSAQGFLWPVQGQVISSFEDNGAGSRSGGINIAARRGTPVRASENGIVAYSGEALSGYGQMILLRHAQGYVTLYAHNDVLLAREGEVVRRGQVIAEVGDSGDVVESQLHFELRRGTEPIDPAKVLAGLPGPVLGLLSASR